MIVLLYKKCEIYGKIQVFTLFSREIAIVVIYGFFA